MLSDAFERGRTRGDRKTTVAIELLMALVASGAAFGIRLALDPVLGSRQPYTPSFGAIAIAAWFGGWRAGSLTAGCSYLLAQYFFVPPRHTLHFGLADVYGGASYWLIAVIAIYLAHRARTAIHALHAMMSQKDRFIAILAHELRNPLGAADLAVQTLKTQATPTHSMAPAVAVVARQIDHMKRLIRDLVELSTMTDGKMQLQLAPTSIQQCVDDAISGNAAAITAKGQELQIVFPDRAIEAVVDGARVTQIISNLLHNASKYSPPKAHITVTVELASDRVHVLVKDDGPGLPEDRVEHLFDRSSPLRAAHSGGGLGIGLWLSHHLADLHGGTLAGSNIVGGHGAEFRLSLPVRGSASKAA